jgi:hypothetical protein
MAMMLTAGRNDNQISYWTLAFFEFFSGRGGSRADSGTMTAPKLNLY